MNKKIFVVATIVGGLLFGCGDQQDKNTTDNNKQTHQYEHIKDTKKEIAKSISIPSDPLLKDDFLKYKINFSKEFVSKIDSYIQDPQYTTTLATASAKYTILDPWNKYLFGEKGTQPSVYTDSNGNHKVSLIILGSNQNNFFMETLHLDETDIKNPFKINMSLKEGEIPKNFTPDIILININNIKTLEHTFGKYGFDSFDQMVDAIYRQEVYHVITTIEDDREEARSEYISMKGNPQAWIKFRIMGLSLEHIASGNKANKQYNILYDLYAKSVNTVKPGFDKTQIISQDTFTSEERNNIAKTYMSYFETK